MMYIDLSNYTCNIGIPCNCRPQEEKCSLGFTASVAGDMQEQGKNKMQVFKG